MARTMLTTGQLPRALRSRSMLLGLNARAISPSAQRRPTPRSKVRTVVPSRPQPVCRPFRHGPIQRATDQEHDQNRYRHLGQHHREAKYEVQDVQPDNRPHKRHAHRNARRQRVWTAPIRQEPHKRRPHGSDARETAGQIVRGACGRWRELCNGNGRFGSVGHGLTIRTLGAEEQRTRHDVAAARLF